MAHGHGHSRKAHEQPSGGIFHTLAIVLFVIVWFSHSIGVGAFIFILAIGAAIVAAAAKASHEPTPTHRRRT